MSRRVWQLGAPCSCYGAQIIVHVYSCILFSTNLTCLRESICTLHSSCYTELGTAPFASLHAMAAYGAMLVYKHSCKGNNAGTFAPSCSG